MDPRRTVARRLDRLLDRFAGRLELSLPPAFRHGDPAAAERAWTQGIEAERLRALALLRELQSVAGPWNVMAETALRFGLAACIESADRWRSHRGRRTRTRCSPRR